MNRKIILSIGLSLLIVIVGLPLTLKQNWRQFAVKNQPRRLLVDTLKNVQAFNELGDILLQQVIADSACVMFRFPPHTCSCLEPDFSEAVNRLSADIGGSSRVFVVIAADNAKDLFYFRERTGLTCPVYSTTDTLLASVDPSRTPYACLVAPDMVARNIVSVNSDNIDELIDYVRKTVH
ncbi:MAG: hypothetical protein LBL04_06140 [Bacteroidales bacterium]|jgi:hypothetical protein|nr:hypothetical protein [Bacteroidales bacterium]